MKTAMIAPNVTLYLKGEEKGEATEITIMQRPEVLSTIAQTQK